MTPNQMGNPFPVFTGLDGSPLDGGFVYFGEVNQNPESNPITVYYDAALTLPAAQPLRTVNGYIMRNGSPTNLFASVDYSITVRNRNGALVVAVASATPTVAGTRLLAANNLSDVDNAATSLVNLGLTATATELNYTDGVTSPIQTQIDTLDADKAPLASPALTGTPTAPTAATGADTTQLATTAFVRGEFERGSGAIATTSGTSITQAIPAGVMNVDVIFDGVESGTTVKGLRLGTGGTPQTTGYTCDRSYITSSTTAISQTTSQFEIVADLNFVSVSGVYSFKRFSQGSNIWVGTFVGHTDLSNAIQMFSSGKVTLSGDLDIIELRSNVAFSAGQVSVRWI